MVILLLAGVPHIITWKPAGSEEAVSMVGREVTGVRNQQELHVLQRRNNCVNSRFTMNTIMGEHPRTSNRNARLPPFLSTWLKGLRASEGHKSYSQALRILHLWNSTFQYNSNISNSLSLSCYLLLSWELRVKPAWSETIVYPSQDVNPFISS